ncbi:MAG TPA: 16S rRNA (guanine(527)-N(7))-methyltransferase RsmG [Bacillota bacterium]|nr:16S rRNA (guanine(527)-N(7))-methyltransferase RsmG [Bacillota bacterium]
MTPKQFVHSLQQKGISLNDQQIEQFAIYFETLVEWNQKMNLTALTDKADVYLKHFYDSLSVAFFHDFSGKKRICDVGAGAGFPSIPLKICFPDLRITIVDSLKKRINFLHTLADKLGIEQTTFIHARAESLGQTTTYRETFDIAIARAVARLSVLSEFCLPLVKEKGIFIAMKGSRVHEELKQAQRSIEIMGGRMQSIQSLTLPKEESERSIVCIDKIKQTPKKYPRKPGLPNKQPIE